MNGRRPVGRGQENIKVHDWLLRRERVKERGVSAASFGLLTSRAGDPRRHRLPKCGAAVIAMTAQEIGLPLERLVHSRDLSPRRCVCELSDCFKRPAFKPFRIGLLFHGGRPVCSIPSSALLAHDIMADGGAFRLAVTCARAHLRPGGAQPSLRCKRRMPAVDLDDSSPRAELAACPRRWRVQR